MKKSHWRWPSPACGPSSGPPDGQPGPTLDLALVSAPPPAPDMAWTSGGCDTGTGRARICTDYFASAAVVDMFRGNCHDLNGIPERWYENGCPHQQAAGGCHQVSASGNAAVTLSYYVPDYSAADVMQGCTKGTIVAP
jgi:hypothetical protein